MLKELFFFFTANFSLSHSDYLYLCLLITFQACDRDPQCGGGMCCAVSIWVKSIRICTPMGKVGDSCHPMTRKVSIYVFLLVLLHFSYSTPSKASMTWNVLEIGNQRRWSGKPLPFSSPFPSERTVFLPSLFNWSFTYHHSHGIRNIS